MKSYDFDAVVYDSSVYCKECLPKEVDIESEEVHPIFADSEWDYAPGCCVCKTVHDYMTILQN